MKKWLILLGIFIVLLVFFAWFLFFSKKDSWICKDGIWIREGSPKNSQPKTPCPGTPKVSPLPEVPPESAVLGFFSALAKAREAAAADTASPDTSRQTSFLTDGFKQKLTNSSAYSCLDVPPETYKIKKSTFNNGKATVAMDVQIEEKKTVLTFDLLASGKEWKIDNVQCPK